jgi:hypothetical protein
VADNVEIQGLEFQIVNDSTQAVTGLQNLINTLNRLKTATNGGATGLSETAQGIRELSNSLKGLNSGDASQKITRLTNALTALSQVGNVKISSSIANQLTAINTALAGLKWTDGDKLTSLANGLRPLSELGKANMTTFINQLSKLPKVIEDLEAADIDKFTQQMTALAAAMKPFADEMQKVSNGFSAFPSKIQKLITSTEKYNASARKATSTTGKFTSGLKALNVAAVAITFRKIGHFIAQAVTESNKYQEDLNLFTVALGQYAAEAQNYAEKVSDVMGIDPAQWLRNQGIFNTLLTGFGDTAERAQLMSQNLTQLGYDISSFFNISIEDAMQKLQSGISGELEPLRRLGYDLSQARLEQTALNLGIKESVANMTQAEKAELRYYAIMTQVTTAQGDMARTLNAPANQLRVLQAQVTQCARAIGNIFIPALNAILPYAIAVAKVIRLIANAIASLFGFALPEIDYSGIGATVGGVADSTQDIGDGLGDATKKAKELKNALLGIDELNIISPPEDTSGSGAGGIGDIGGGGLGFDLPTYDFLDGAISSKVDEIVQKMKEWLGLNKEIDSWADLFDTRLGKILLTVGAIGAGLAAWKIAKSVADFVKYITSFKGFGAGWAGLGALGLLSDLNEFIGYFQDFLENGATFQNVVGMISEFTGAIGDCLIILGNLKIGGALKVVQGIGEIAVAIKDISESGVNWENANTAIRGLTNIAIGIGVFTGNLKVAAWGLAIQGFTSIITEIGANWDAIKQGDWSGVDKVTLIIGALEVLGGLAMALDVFSKLKEVATIGKASEAVTTVATATETLDTTVSTKLSPNLTSLAKNLGLGIVIVAEVAAAALLITGAIILLGEGLAQVGESWQPVINNGGTVLAAMGIGIGILAVVGIVTALLGSVGTPLIVNIALGTAILAELGIATGLFLVEIWAIGKGLDEIGQAWQPVLDNGETIATAIGLGTALLVELAAAFIIFTESLIAVANELGDNLAPALDRLNDKLPTLSTNMSEFVDFMTDFAGEVVRYTEVSAIAGLSATIDTIIGWFTQDPVEKLADDVENIYNQTTTLNEKLNLAVPELKTAINLLKQYKGFLTEMETLCNSNVELSTGMFVNMKEVGQKLVTGFVDGIKSKSSDFSNAAKTLVDGFKNSLNTNAATCKSSLISWASNLKNWFTSASFGAINRTTFGNYAKDIVSGFNNGITNNYATAKSGMVSFANTVKNAFTGIVSYKVFYDIAKDVISGFNNGINDFYDTTRPYMRRWANDAAAAYKAALDSNSPSKRFMRIGEDTVLGYNLGIANLGGTTKGVVTDWANSFTSVNPTMSFAVDTSALKYYSSDSFAQSVSADVAAHSTVTATDFKEGMEEFYREYIEPTLSQMADDMRRQADKQEQTVVQIGNRVVNDAVTTQKKANGYVFAR